MNQQFRIAEATGAGTSNKDSHPRIFKLTKPFADQAVVVNLGYDQKVQVDFTAIANEKITLVHVGEKLIILFDNQSTVTIEPFFDSRHDQLGNLTIEVAPGRELTVSEFASSFPITTDSSVLPAAGTEVGQANAQASGAHFTNPTIDPLETQPGLPLLGPETLPHFQVELPTGPALQSTTPPITPPKPTITLGAMPDLVVDESFLSATTNGIAGSGQAPLGQTVASGLIPVSITTSAGQQSLTFALSVSQGVDSGLIDSQTGNHVFLFLENGQVVGREGKDAAAAAAGLKDFTIAVDAAGNVTLTDLRSVHENTPGDLNEGISLASGLVTLTATVTDNAGQTASASIDLGPQITVHDDGPVVTVTGVTPTLVVDESFIPGIGSQVAVAGSPNSNVASGVDFGSHFSVIAGADGQLGNTAFSLTIGNATTNLVDSKTGQTVLLATNGTSEVDGYVMIGGVQTNVFTLTVDATGHVTFTELRGVKEATADPNGDTSEGVSLSSGLVSLVATVTDNDGDKASASIDLGPQITVHDDGPTNITPIGIVGADLPTWSGSSLLEFAGHSGADGATVVFSSVGPATLAGYTVGGHQIDLTGWGTTTLTATDHVNGSTVFTIVLHPDELNSANDYYTFTLDQKIDNGAGVTFNASGGVSGGNSHFFAINNSGNIDELITGIDPSTQTVNTNANDIGVGPGSQFVNAGEGLRFELVTYSQSPTNQTTTAQLAGDISGSQETHNFQFTVDQLKNNSTAQLHIDAIEGNGQVITGGTTGTEVHLNEIVILSGGNTYDFTATGSQSGHTVTFNANGSVNITGLLTNDVVQIFSADQFNRVEITNTSASDQLANGSSFDITNTGLLSVNTGNPVSLSAPLTVTDGDGDTASGAINVTLDPTHVISGTAAGESLIGTSGNDTLIGGGGVDTLTGNGGNDIFVLPGSGGGPATITDFSALNDQIFVDVASQNLTIGTSTVITAGQFTSSAVTGGDQNAASAWNESNSANKFFFNNATGELWYSAAGNGSDKVDLAHVSTGVPAATNIHTM
jgi:hypothetical protein